PEHPLNHYKNMASKDDLAEVLRAPISFRPVFKRTIWGGRKLHDSLGKAIGAESDYAESWELVDHGEDQCVVDGGPCDGLTLRQLIEASGERLLGPGIRTDAFPLLLKYLDCNRVLSVQVHPDDAYAQKMPKPDLGKTEAWYIVESEPDSLIYAGLKEGVSRQILSEAIEAGQTEELLHQFHPSVGDVVFIPAGTVHALGEGLLVAEIQQSSDTTFRMFDWNRTDAEGNARPLHIEQSLEVTDYEAGPVSPIRSDHQLEGVQTVVDCDKFRLDLLHRGDAQLDCPTIQILTVASGRCQIEIDARSLILERGQTVVLPGSMPSTQVLALKDDNASSSETPTTMVMTPAAS
ncbi:MAG: type I phosphomannose isomerase catalytic subunit, partial [Planctomycetota bacterium]